MARLLYRIGTYSATHRLVIISAWLTFMTVAGFIALTASSLTDEGFTIPGAESSQALTTLDREFPGTSEETQQFDVVFQTTDGGSILDPNNVAIIDSTLAQVARLPDVTDAASQLTAADTTISEGGNVGIARFSVAGLQDDDPAMTAVMDEVGRIAETTSGQGITAEIGGGPDGGGPALLNVTELIGAGVAFLVLFITLGSLAAAGANMLTALFSVLIGVGSVLAYSSVSAIQSSTLILAIMLGLAVAIDYTLFILSRFRSELRDGRTVPESVGIALGTAGSAVVFAGSTVVIALAGLAVVNIPFITEMGLAAAAAVVVAVLIALTLVPVILTGLGYRTLPASQRDAARAATMVAPGSRTPSVGSGEPMASTDRQLGFFSGWANVVTRRPRVSIFSIVAVLALLAFPVLSMETALSIPGGAVNTTERRAYDIVSESFGRGYQTPLIVLVEGDDATTQSAAIAETVRGLDDVASVSPAQANDANTAAIFQVISVEGPNDERTAGVVKEIRSAFDGLSGLNVSVTGQTAVDIDVTTQLNGAFLVYLLVIVGLALLLLILMFRSIIVPLMATFGFLLSLGSAMGITIATFQWGWFGSFFGVGEAMPIPSLLPIIIVGILFGLAMDYQVFLVSRIHEAYSRGASPQDAILTGFNRSSTVVAAAAIIMGSVFFGFAFSGGGFVALIGTALAIGILIDAFIIRMIFIPATLAFFGDKAWWIPSWLDRLLPRIDAEGSSLVPPASPRDAVVAGSPAD